MADRYWVGGTGTWDASDTTNWSTTSGGAGGASAPTSVDDVYFDANSDGGGTFTVTAGTGIVCKNVTIDNLNNAMTLIRNVDWDIYGSLFFPATNFTHSSSTTSIIYINFLSSSTETITTNGINLTPGTTQKAIRFNGTGTFTLGSSLTCTTGQGNGMIFLKSGTLDTANFSISTNVLFTESGGTNPILVCGSSTITVNYGATAPGVFTSSITLDTSTFFTLDAGTSTFIVTGNSHANFRGHTLYNLTINAATQAVNRRIYWPTEILNDLVITYPATSSACVTIECFSSCLVWNSISVNAGQTDPTKRIFFISTTFGTSQAFICNGPVTFDECDFRDIELDLYPSMYSGPSMYSTVTITNAGDCGGNTGITFPSPKTVYLNAGASGTVNFSSIVWAASSGGTPAANLFPLAQDTLIIDDNSGSNLSSLTQNSQWNIGELLSTKTTNSVVTFNFGAFLANHYGNITLSSKFTLNAANRPQGFVKRGNMTVDFAGNTVVFPNLQINLLFNTFTHLSDSNVSGGVTFSNTNINLNGFNFYVTGTLYISGTATIDFLSGGKLQSASSIQSQNVSNIDFIGESYFEINPFNVSPSLTKSVWWGNQSGLVTPESKAPNVYFIYASGPINIGNGFQNAYYKNLYFADTVSASIQYAFVVYGNLRLSPNMDSVDSGYALNLNGSTTQTLEFNNISLKYNIVRSTSGAVTLVDNAAISATKTFTLTGNTLNLNGNTLSVGTFSSSNSNTREIIFDGGTIDVTGASFDVATSTNLTLTGTSNILMSSASAKTFAGGSKTYSYLKQNGAGDLTITGTNTFGELAGNVSSTIIFPNVTTNIGKWSVNGRSGAAVTLARTGASGTFTLNYTGTGVAQGDYLVISNSTATPANTWYAGSRSTDSGGNTDWNFTFSTLSDRYWVGGTGTWDASTTTNWASWSSGDGGVDAPISTNNAYFDANSDGGGTFTVTLSGLPTCNSLLVYEPSQLLSFAGASFTLRIYGSLLFPTTNRASTANGIIQFLSTSSGNTITMNGFDPVRGNGSGYVLNGVGGEWTLGSAFSATDLGQLFRFSNGTFNTDNYNFTISIFRTEATGTRTLNLGSSLVTITYGASTSYGWHILSPATTTISPGTSKLLFTGSTFLFNGGDKTYYDFEASSVGLRYIKVDGSNTFNNFNVLGRTTFSYAGSSDIYFSGNTVINGIFSAGSQTENNACRVHFRSDTRKVPRTITAASVSLVNTSFRDITAAGAAIPFSGTLLGDAYGNTNINFEPAKTVYLVSGSNVAYPVNAVWSLTSGGTGSIDHFPLPQDTLVIDDNSPPAFNNIFYQIDLWIGNFDASSRTTTFNRQQNGAQLTVYGSYIAPSSVYHDQMAAYGTGFEGRGNHSLLIANSLRRGVIFSGGTYTLIGNSTIALDDPSYGIFTFTDGTIDLNNFTLSVGRLHSDSTDAKTIAFGTGKIVITGSRPDQTLDVFRMNASNLTVSGSRRVEVTTSTSNPTCTRRISGQTISASNSNTTFDVYVTNDVDTVSINFQPGTTARYRDLNFTGFNGTITSTDHVYIDRDLTIPVGVTISSTQAIYFNSETGNIQNVDVNGLQFNNFFIKANDGTLVFQSSFATGADYTFTHSAGTVDINDQYVSVGKYNVNNSNIRAIDFGTGGVLEISGSGVSFDAGTSTNLTVTGTGIINMTSASAKTFNGGGKSYPALNQAGAGALTIQGANTFTNILNTYRPATVIFPANTTTTVNDLYLNGGDSDLITVQSSSNGTQFTISKSSGQVGLYNCSIKDSNVVGGALFLAPLNYGNVDAGNNTGWSFNNLDTKTDNFMFYFADTIRIP